MDSLVCVCVVGSLKAAVFAQGAEHSCFPPLSRDAQMIMEDIKKAVSELEQESSIPPVGVELVDNELATLYMNSKKSEVHSCFISVGLNNQTDSGCSGSVFPPRAEHSLGAVGLGPC